MTFPPHEQPTSSEAQPDGGLGRILALAVAGLGVLIALLGFAPAFTASTAATETGVPGLSLPGSSLSTTLYEASDGAMLALFLVAGLLAATVLLPKQRSGMAIVAALSVAGLVAVVFSLVSVGGGLDIGWGFWLVLVLGLLQAGAAVFALLLDAGVVSPPAPKSATGPTGQPTFGQGFGGQHGGPQQPGQQPFGGPPGAAWGAPGQQQSPQFGAPQHGGPQQPGPQQGSQQFGGPQHQAPPQQAPQYGDAPQYGGEAPQYGQPGAQQPGQQPYGQGGAPSGYDAPAGGWGEHDPATSKVDRAPAGQEQGQGQPPYGAPTQAFGAHSEESRPDSGDHPR